MLTLEIALLVLGVVALVCAGFLTVWEHRIHRTERASEPTPNPGLIPDDSFLQMLDQVPPGMVGSLVDDTVAMLDVVTTLVHLAARGYLQIQPLIDTPSTGLEPEPYDWLMTRTSKTPDHLEDFEITLLTLPFSGVNVREDGVSATTVSAMVDDRRRAIPKVREQLNKRTVDQGWFHSEAQAYRNAWGLAGGSLLLVALGGFIVMIIGGLTTSTIKGSIGAALIAASGILIASLGRFQTPRTEAGDVAAATANRLRQHLSTLSPELVDLPNVSNQFNKLLPYAIVFGLTDKVARVFQDAIARANRWGGNFRVNAPWFDSAPLGLDEDSGPAEIAHAVEGFTQSAAKMASLEFGQE